MKRTPRIHHFGPFEFDATQQELRSATERVTLPIALNKLLLLFVSRPGELITRDDIATTLWDDQNTVDITNGINSAIRRLRIQLGEGKTSDTYIATVVGTGYRFIAPVTVSATEDTNDTEAAPEPDEAITAETGSIALPAAFLPPAGRRWSWPHLSLAAALLLATALGLFHWWPRAPKTGPATLPDIALPLPFFSRLIPVTYDELDDKLSAQAISPSGNYLVYSDRSGITLQTLDSHADRLIASPPGLSIDHIAWFPDEQRLLVSGDRSNATAAQPGRNEAWVVSLTGAPPRLLVQDAQLATVSPNGERIAFTRAMSSEVWTATADGLSPHKLLASKAGDSFPCLLWSPDSHRLVVNRYSIVERSRLDAALRASNNPLDQLQVQHHAVYESYDATTGARLARRDDLAFDSGVLLQDGSLIYPVNTPAKGAQLAVVPTNPSTGEVVGDPSFLPPAEHVWVKGTYTAIQLSAPTNGKRIAAILERPTVDVYLADVRFNGTVPSLEHISRLTHHTGTSYPTSWNPEGDEVLFDNGDAGPSVIAAQKIDTATVRVLSDTNLDATGQFSPDGKWVLFLHFRTTPKLVQSIESIERVPAAGGKPERLFVPGEIEEFHCSNASTGICVVRETVGKNQLVYYELDPIHGRGRELARTPWQPNVLGDWSLSPDGTTVAMANHDPAHPCIQIVHLATQQPNGQQPATQTSEIPVTGYGTVLEPTWAPNGKDFFVETHTDTGYNLLYLDHEGHITTLRQSSDLIWAVPSRDGKRLAFPGLTPMNRNVWVGFTHIPVAH
jgi:DNA-binding winged helix-turn-helix (wHTH) protein/Tol biopolymer transport system component